MTFTPKRIFLESTALVQLGQKLENVDFEKLLQLRDSAGFRIYISEVSWLEFMRKRKKDLSFFTDSCSKAERTLEKHGKSIPEIGAAFAKVKEYIDNIEAHYRNRAQMSGIEIVPVAPVDIDLLLKMSIECIPPFEQAEDDSKEKGFRDSLIMFSILESLKNCPDEPAMVITQDKLLSGALDSRATEYGVNLIVVQSLDEATNYVVKTLAESEQMKIKQESLDAIRMLDSYKENIANKIAEIREITDRDLGQGFRWGLMREFEQEGLDIRNVQSIAFQRVDSAIWKERNSATPRILFRCLCKATVIIRAPYRVTPLTEPRRFEIGESPSPPGLTYNVLTGVGATFARTEERELPFTLYGVAEFQRPSEAGAHWQLVGLRVDKSVPSEEFDALTAAEIPQPG